MSAWGAVVRFPPAAALKNYGGRYDTKHSQVGCGYMLANTLLVFWRDVVKEEKKVKDIAYQCLNCGAVNITKYDGHKCGSCQGFITPIGTVIYLDKPERREIQIGCGETGHGACDGSLLSMSWGDRDA